MQGLSGYAIWSICRLSFMAGLTIPVGAALGFAGAQMVGLVQ